MARRISILVIVLATAVAGAQAIAIGSGRQGDAPPPAVRLPDGAQSVDQIVGDQWLEDRPSHGDWLLRRTAGNVAGLIFIVATLASFWGYTARQKLVGRSVLVLMVATLAYHTFEPNSLFDPGGGLILGLATMIVLCCWALTIRTYQPDFQAQDRRDGRRHWRDR